MVELEEASDRERWRRDDQTYQPGKNLQWWACSNTKSSFVGCCSVDPCDGAECPDPPEWQEVELGKKDERATSDVIVSTIRSVGPPEAVTSAVVNDDGLLTPTRISIRSTKTVETTITVKPSMESENPWFATLTKHTSTSDGPTIVPPGEPTESSSNGLDPSTTADIIPTTGDAGATPQPSSSDPVGPDSPPDSENAGFGSLPASTRMGVYVGVPVAVAIAAFVFFIFFRRRRRSQGQSSIRDASSPKYDDDKFLPKTTSNPTSPVQSNDGANESEDVFAPFGGQYTCPSSELITF